MLKSLSIRNYALIEEVEITFEPGLNILTGESIKWRYTVTNAGNVALSNILVTDSQSGVTPGYVSGDTNTNGKLDLGPWEQVFYGEFDGQRRKRVLVKVIGE